MSDQVYYNIVLRNERVELHTSRNIDDVSPRRCYPETMSKSISERSAASVVTGWIHDCTYFGLLPWSFKLSDEVKGGENYASQTSES
jgi:hypothetical protein